MCAVVCHLVGGIGVVWGVVVWHRSLEQLCVLRHIAVAPAPGGQLNLGNVVAIVVDGALLGGIERAD